MAPPSNMPKCSPSGGWRRSARLRGLVIAPGIITDAVDLMAGEEGPVFTEVIRAAFTNKSGQQGRTAAITAVGTLAAA